jgi:hypothetical protein
MKRRSICATMPKTVMTIRPVSLLVETWGSRTGTAAAAHIREILATVKPLATEYYPLTDKPLEVTGEVAEFIASEILGCWSTNLAQLARCGVGGELWADMSPNP